MPDYNYYAVDRNGAPIHGVMPADNQSKLEEKLEELGYWVVEAKEQSRRRKTSSSRVSRRELIDFFNGMAVLLEAGVNAADALKAMIEETNNETFRRVLEDLEVNVESGMSIHESMSKYPKIFSDQVCNIVHAGEYGGNLAITFEDISEHLEWVDQVISDVKQVSIYPAMIILAVIGLISLMLSFVIPKFIAIFDSAGLQLPAITRAIVTLGDYWWKGILVVVVLAVAVIVSAKYIHSVQVAMDKLKFSVPVFGSINRMLVLSRFVHNFALMVKSGVPILDALKLCRGLVGSPLMEEVIKDAEMAVNDGRRMSEALREHDIVPPLVMRMLVVGEETGNLEQALKHVSKRYNSEVPRHIKRAFAILEPTIIVFLIGVVGVMAAAVFLPMFSLMSGIG